MRVRKLEVLRGIDVGIPLVKEEESRSTMVKEFQVGELNIFLTGLQVQVLYFQLVPFASLSDQG